MLLSTKEILLPLIAVILVVGPLWILLRKGINTTNAKTRILAQVAIFVGVFLVVLLFQAHSYTTLAEEASKTAATGDLAKGLGFIAAGLSVGGACLGAGLAVAAAPAAIGAVSENGDNFGRAIIFVALGEGVAIYGLLISILIINAL